MGLTGGRERLARTAYSLKKAWLLCVAIVEFERLPPRVSAADLAVPDYSRWSRSKLQSQVTALEDDLHEILKPGVQFTRSKKQLHQIARWLEQHFDRWQEGGGGYTISTVFEFEHHVGRLRSRERTERHPTARCFSRVRTAWRFATLSTCWSAMLDCFRSPRRC